MQVRTDDLDTDRQPERSDPDGDDGGRQVAKTGGSHPGRSVPVGPVPPAEPYRPAGYGLGVVVGDSRAGHHREQYGVPVGEQFLPPQPHLQPPFVGAQPFSMPDGGAASGQGQWGVAVVAGHTF